MKCRFCEERDCEPRSDFCSETCRIDFWNEMDRQKRIAAKLDPIAAAAQDAIDSVNAFNRAMDRAFRSVSRKKT